MLKKNHSESFSPKYCRHSILLDQIMLHFFDHQKADKYKFLRFYILKTCLALLTTRAEVGYLEKHFFNKILKIN